MDTACWEDGVAVSFLSFSATLPFRIAQSRPHGVSPRHAQTISSAGNRTGGEEIHVGTGSTGRWRRRRRRRRGTERDGMGFGFKSSPYMAGIYAMAPMGQPRRGLCLPAALTAIHQTGNPEPRACVAADGLPTWILPPYTGSKSGRLLVISRGQIRGGCGSFVIRRTCDHDEV